MFLIERKKKVFPLIFFLLLVYIFLWGDIFYFLLLGIYGPEVSPRH